jgi:rod shape determining protein RodA
LNYKIQLGLQLKVMRKETGIFQNIDLWLVGMYLVLVTMGWLNVYASVFNEQHYLITDMTQKYGKQLIWIISSLFIAILILVVEGKESDPFG